MAVLVTARGTLSWMSAQRSATVALEEAWRVCADLYAAATVPPSGLSRASFERELIFCLLSGFSVSYEHALSASELVAALEPFEKRWSARKLEERLQIELSRPQFEPRRRDGSLRRYRFPTAKARLLVGAREWLSSSGDIVAKLTGTGDEGERRRILCGCPGVGPKTASWLLRNLGLGADLAILDIHLLRALRAAGRIGEVSLPRDYERAERAFLDWCRELNAPAAAFDLFVWDWQRGSLSRA